MRNLATKFRDLIYEKIQMQENSEKNNIDW